jgi:alpha-beta hydrolase superfamily lysophospholipase
MTTAKKVIVETQPRTESPSLVLVHGGMLGPWTWSDVATLLKQQGLSVYILDLPSVGDSPEETPLGDFYADVAEVRRVLDQVYSVGRITAAVATNNGSTSVGCRTAGRAPPPERLSVKRHTVQ